MIQVGIHKNLVLKSAEKNDKGSLVITWKKGNGGSLLDSFNSNSANSVETPEQPFIIFPPRCTNMQGEPDTTDRILGKIAEVKDPLNLILSQYTTSDKIKWDVFTGTGIEVENMDAKLANDDMLKKIYDNIVDQFLNMIKPFVGENGKKMRMLFIRASQAKHFPKMRTRFLDSQPFIEPMDVPVSKLAFSKYEKDRGLDNPNQAGGETKVDEEEAKSAENFFKEEAVN